jgi:pectin methylesterase-like acyl-CoA thioesterase
MLTVDVPNVTLKNAGTGEVKITSYYGGGYSYYSMGTDYRFNANVLAANIENGYPSRDNARSNVNAFWNATVVVSADNFTAEGIIFENSFTPGNKTFSNGDRQIEMSSYSGSRNSAAAIFIADNSTEIFFDDCIFIGKKNVIYGGSGASVAFYGGEMYGNTDIIFGGMTAVIAKTEIEFNGTSDTYSIAAPAQTSGRGFLFYNCEITGEIGGYFGRPMRVDSGEAVFYKTVIGKNDDGESLILPVGWLSTLAGESAKCMEYATF